MLRNSKQNNNRTQATTQQINNQLKRLRAISVISIGSDPLSGYKLETVVVKNPSTNTFIMKKYPTVLWQVSLFGIDNAIYTRHVYAQDRYGSEYSLLPREFPLSEAEIKEFSAKVALKYYLLLVQKIQDEAKLCKDVAGVISEYVIDAARKNKL